MIIRFDITNISEKCANILQGDTVLFACSINVITDDTSVLYLGLSSALLTSLVMAALLGGDAPNFV